MQYKTLKFDANLVPLILSGEKTSTWRLLDDKELATGDIVDLLRRDTLESIGQAELTKVVEKPLGQLTAEDKVGHADYASNQVMYENFARMYKREVGPETMVKIVQFKRL